MVPRLGAEREYPGDALHVLPLVAGELLGRATRLTQVVGRMQASTSAAQVFAGYFGKVVVDGQKDGPESGSARQSVIHDRVLRSCGKPRSTPLKNLDPVIRLFEGNFVGCPNNLAEKSPISRRLPWSRTSRLS
jgi:hypothetical protein